MVVLEARARGASQTGRTAGHLMLWNDDYYHKQEQVPCKSCGLAQARRAGLHALAARAGVEPGDSKGSG